MSISINTSERKRLAKILSYSIAKRVKKDNLGTSASIAYTPNGSSYVGAGIESDTNLLHISSEQAALTLAMHHNDFTIHRIVTLFENEMMPISPLVLKTLIDWSIRTGEDIRYTVIDLNGTVLFDEPNLRHTLAFYRPTPAPLAKVAAARIGVPTGTLTRVTPAALKRFALRGLTRNFPTYDSASGYGATVVTKSGKVYFGGQYSSFEKRTGLHAEMAVMTGALMMGFKNITHLGLVSGKYTDTPCAICGCCRQFLAELSLKRGFTLELICFAKDTPDYKISNMDTLLPDLWSSKKWQ